MTPVGIQNGALGMSRWTARTEASPSQVLAVLTVILAIAVLGRGAEPPRIWYPCVLGLMALTAAVWAGLSKTRLMLLPSVALVQLMPVWRPISLAPAATFSHLIRLAGYSMTFELVRWLDTHSDRTRWRLLVPIIAIAAFEGAVCLWQAVRLPWHRYAPGTFGNHNHAAGLLAMALPVAVAWTIFERRLPGVLACLAISAGLVATVSRGGVVAGVIGLLSSAVVYLARGRAPSRIRLTFAACSLLLVVVGVAVLPRELRWRFSQYATFEGWREDVRVNVWSHTIRLWEAHPLLGCGLGAYRTAYGSLQAEPVWDHCDNDYLQFLAEAGLLGFAAVAIAIAKPICSSFRALTPTVVAALGGLAALLAHGFTDSNFYTPANAMTFAWLLAIVQTDMTSKERKEI